jgi:hypothetical protein
MSDIDFSRLKRESIQHNYLACEALIFASETEWNF